MLDTEMMGGFGERMEQEVQEQESPRETRICLFKRGHKTS